MLATATISAEHLLIFKRAFLGMYILLEGVDVEESQHLSTRVVGPVRSKHFLLHRARVHASPKRLSLRRLLGGDVLLGVIMRVVDRGCRRHWPAMVVR